MPTWLLSGFSDKINLILETPRGQNSARIFRNCDLRGSRCRVRLEIDTGQEVKCQWASYYGILTVVVVDIVIIASCTSIVSRSSATKTYAFAGA